MSSLSWLSALQKIICSPAYMYNNKINTTTTTTTKKRKHTPLSHPCLLPAFDISTSGYVCDKVYPSSCSSWWTMSRDKTCDVENGRFLRRAVQRRLGHLSRSTTSGITNAAPELIPTGYEQECSLLRTQWAYKHIRWMVQKDALDQDMFLVGSHSPLRRWLAFRFCEVTNRECEFVAFNF